MPQENDPNYITQYKPSSLEENFKIWQSYFDTKTEKTIAIKVEAISKQEETMPLPLQEGIDLSSKEYLSKLFKEFVVFCNNSTYASEVLKYVYQGTNHTTLSDFHNDYNIALPIKVFRYATAMERWANKAAGFVNTPNITYRKDFTDKIKQLEEQVTTLHKASKEAISDKQQELDSVKKQLAEIDKERPIHVIVQTHKGKELGKITTKHHKQLPTILKLLTARNAMGFPEQLYIHGAPGAGKTHLSRQVAEGLGVRCFTYPLGPTITEGKLLGFNNIATGTFIAGWLYEAYKNGGLVALDEADLADASVLAAANSIDNDQFIFGNGEIVKRHHDFYLIAFANTIGTGATKGFVRNVLDAATRDRFTMLKLEYDEELEQQIYGHKQWAIYVQKIRKYIETQSGASNFYITPRATRKGAAYLNAGMDPDLVAEIVLFKGCSNDMRNSIIQNVGKFATKVAASTTPGYSTASSQSNVISELFQHLDVVSKPVQSNIAAIVTWLKAQGQDDIKISKNAPYINAACQHLTVFQELCEKVQYQYFPMKFMGEQFYA